MKLSLTVVFFPTVMFTHDCTLNSLPPLRFLVTISPYVRPLSLSLLISDCSRNSSDLASPPPTSPGTRESSQLSTYTHEPSCATMQRCMTEWLSPLTKPCTSMSSTRCCFLSFMTNGMDPHALLLVLSQIVLLARCPHLLVNVLPSTSMLSCRSC